jgi:hypothetical protein
VVQRAPSRVAEKRYHFLVSVEGVTTLLGIPASILNVLIGVWLGLLVPAPFIVWLLAMFASMF